jgi:hypothetical protein
MYLNSKFVYLLLYNKSIHSSINVKPDDILNKYNETQKEQLSERQEVKFRQRHKLADNTPLPLNTKVRILIQERVKATIKDKASQTYSTEIYTIAKLIKSNIKTLSRNRYKLRNSDGTLLPKTYNESSFIVIERVDEPPNITVARPRIIGKIKNKEINDLVILPVKKPLALRRLVIDRGRR